MDSIHILIKALDVMIFEVKTKGTVWTTYGVLHTLREKLEAAVKEAE